MASGHMNRVKRPDTWLHRPMLRNVKKVLANPELSTHENWECLNSRTCSVCGVLRYHGANARPDKNNAARRQSVPPWKLSSQYRVCSSVQPGTA